MSVRPVRQMLAKTQSPNVWALSSAFPFHTSELIPCPLEHLLCLLFRAERGGEGVAQILKPVRAAHGETEAGLSAVTIVELTHGIYRAKTDADRKRRQSFTDELCHDVPVHPVTLEVAQVAGKIEGEQAAHGISIAFEDLLIGSTALHLGYSVATLNARHFRLIPGLSVVQF